MVIVVKIAMQGMLPKEMAGMPPLLLLKSPLNQAPR
jgi:hypothetical protein